jgi:hypothetical protein
VGWIEDRLDDDFEPWLDSLTDDEIQSLLNYQGRNFALYNAFFRDPDGVADELDDQGFALIEEVTERIDAVLERGSLQRDVTCYRGLKDFGALFGRRSPSEIVGFGFEERAYCSTSTDEYRARRFVENGFLLVFEAPAGTGAAWMPMLQHETYSAQRELLLERGLWFRVENVWQDSDTLYVGAKVE